MSYQLKETSELLLERALDAENCNFRSTNRLTSTEVNWDGWRSVVGPMLEPNGLLSGPFVASTLHTGWMPEALSVSQNIFHVSELPEPNRYPVLQVLRSCFPGHYMMLAANVACYHVRQGRLHDDLLRLAAEIAHEHFQRTAI